MTRFVLGMLAAGLWIAATVAVVLLTRASPDPPRKSIRSFRRARRQLAPRRSRPKLIRQEALPLPLTSTETNASPPPTPASSYQLTQGGHPLDTVEEIPVMAPLALEESSPPPPPEQEGADAEMAEIAAVIEAVTDESVIPKRHRLASTSGRLPPRGPRKVGRVTYVLVDDEGKPLD